MAETAVALKDEGNALFRSGEWLKAAATYTKAIKLDPGNAVLYSNRAAALSKLCKVKQALADAEKAVELDPGWAKGHFRRGCVLEEAKRFVEALPCFQRAAELDSQNPDIAKKIRELTKVPRGLDRRPPQRQPDATPASGSSSAGPAVSPPPPPAQASPALRQLLHQDVTSNGEVPMRLSPFVLASAGLRRDLIRCSGCGRQDADYYLALERTLPPSRAPLPQECLRLSCLDCLARRAAAEGVAETPEAVERFANAALMGSIEACAQIAGTPSRSGETIFGPLPTLY